MKVPQWLKSSVSEEGLDRIESAVVAAEKKTSGEIVPMIVHRSIPIGHVTTILFLGQVLFLWLLVPYLTLLWPQLPVAAFEIAAVVIAAGTTSIQRGWGFWERLLTSNRDQELSVLRRAQLEFYQSNIKATAARTGVLVMVSHVEHRAVILADQAVAEKLPSEVWDELIALLITKIKSGDFAGGMCEVIERIGALLEKSFPCHPEDRDELANHLQIKE